MRTIAMAGLGLLLAMAPVACGPPDEAADESAAGSETASGEGGDPSATDSATGGLVLFDAHSHLVPDWPDGTLQSIVADTGLQGMAILGTMNSFPLQKEAPDTYAACMFYEVGKTALADVEAALNKGARCIGEVSIRHFASSAVAAKAFDATDPEMVALYELAAARGVPITVHFDYSEEFIGELDIALKENSTTTFIWAHLGDTDAETVGDLMDKYDNLYADLSSRNPLFTRGFDVEDQRLTEADGTIKAGWKALFEAKPDRFLFGTDIGPADRHTYVPDIVAYYMDLLGQLNPTTAAKIGSENAHTLFGF